MTLSAWIAATLGVLFIGFIVFAFRQGMKVRNPPEGVPPERWPSG